MRGLLTGILIGGLALLSSPANAVTMGSITQKTGAPLYAGEWQVIHDSGELTSAVTSYTISGLDGDTDQEYRLIGRFINGYSGIQNISLYFNNDTNPNYGYQRCWGNGSSPGASRSTSNGNWPITDNVALNDISFTDTIIYAKSGYVRTGRTLTCDAVSATTVTYCLDWGHSWDNTVDNITSLVIASSETNGINVGSRMILLARRPFGSEASSGMKYGDVNVKGKVNAGIWQLVERHEVTGSAIDSYSFNNLDGNTDVLYEVRARIVSNTTLGGMYYTIPNDDHTWTKYGRQYLTGQNTTVTAAREAGSAIGARTTSWSIGNNELTYYTFLMYAKSGYVRTSLSDYTSGISGTTVGERGFGGHVWNDTSTNITSITVLSDQVYGLGIGTVLELWALRLGN